MEKFNEKDSVALLRECYYFLNEVLNRKLDGPFKQSYDLASAVGNYLKQIEKHDTGSSENGKAV